MKNKINLDEVNIYNIIEEYEPDDDIFNDENEKVHKVKNIIYKNLSETDRRIILLYTEVGNMRDCAKLMKVSTFTMFNQINRIRTEIKNIYATI